MKSSAPSINWVTLSSSNLSLIPGSTSPYQISGTLGISTQDNSGYFSLTNNVLQISAPQNTPVQIGWLQVPGLSVNGATITLSFTGINYAFAGSPALAVPLAALYPLTLFNIPPNATPAAVGILNNSPTPVSLAFSSLDGGSLVSVCLNTEPNPPAGATWAITYTLVFLGSDGNTYEWDPVDDIEHSGGTGSMSFKR